MDARTGLVSTRSLAAAHENAALEAFLAQSATFGPPDPELSVFTFGNPQEMPLDGLVEALRDSARPRSVDWFAYRASDPGAQELLAASLTAELGVPFEPADVQLTTGAFGAIALAFQLLTDPGDAVVIPRPGWFLYAPLLRLAGAVPVEVPLDRVTWDLDLAAIDAAITPGTRMVVVNSPHNPTGRVYGPETWAALAELLEAASARVGHRVFLLSDEPYRRIRMDGRPFSSPAAAYPWTLVDYSYGKVLLAPGQRLGYLAVSALMPAEDRAALRAAAFSTQVSLGWAFPEAVMQHSVAALEDVSIDVPALQARRDVLLDALVPAGWELAPTEGTFYLWGRAPAGQSLELAAWLKERKVLVLPGTLFHMPEHVRLSLTATDAMVERALPALVEAASAPWRA